MPKISLLMLVVLVTGLAGPAAGAQGLAGAPPPVKVTRLIDRPEFRLSRNEILPHSTRAAHKHDDTQYFVFMPVSAALDLTIEGQAPMHLEPWQAYLMKGDVVHAFSNPSSVPVQFVEIFVTAR
jgi:hypothetical protein